VSACTNTQQRVHGCCVTIFRRPICSDCLDRARSTRSGHSGPDFFSLAPLTHPVPRSVIFSLSPSSLSSFFCNSRQPHPSLLSAEPHRPPFPRPLSSAISTSSFCLSTFLLRLFFSSASLAYLTAASAAASATENERMGREENGPQREERRERSRLGEAGIRASEARTSESPMQRGCNCVNLIHVPSLIAC